MYLDYSKLEFDQYGRPEIPELTLETMSYETIGILPGVHNLKFRIKLSEPSEMTFDVPAKLEDGQDNPFYDEVRGHRIIRTNTYGVYVIMNPSTSSDGVEEVKSVTAYSCEKELESKRFFLDEGTFKFCNLTNPYDGDTLIGRILEIAIGWNPGYISPDVAARYRTFDQYDEDLLSFVYNEAPEKYRCIFVFEPYNKTINVYDADETRQILPIYLDFDNLVESVEVEEQSDELVTALRPYGADELDIRAVNPIGTNWIYDLSHFIEIGDIPQALTAKWQTWKRSILNRQAYYKGLVGLQASATARKLAAQAALTDLEGELDTLTAQQSVTIQALALETTDAGKQYQQNLLENLNYSIATKRSEISAKETEIEQIGTELESYSAKIQAVVDELSLENYFTNTEQETLSHYFKETDLVEETFVATDVDVSISGSSFDLKNATIIIQNANITKVDLSDTVSKQMYVIAGGTFAISANHELSGDVIRGTLEAAASGKFVLSIYGGSMCHGDTTAPSGTLTLSGTLSGLTSDIAAVTVDEVTTYEGTRLNFNCASGDFYLTTNVSDYQKYSVQMELYDYAVGVLSDLATPTYEFEIDSANFLFAQEFASFRNKLELGCGVYLNLGRGQTITPLIIEMEFDFEDWSKVSLIFSNRFKRDDECNTLKDLVEDTHSNSRNLETNQYINGRATNQASQVSAFMQSALDYAVNRIKSAANETVTIDGSGIHIYKDYRDDKGIDRNCELRMTNGMIAFTNDNWATSKLALGLFATESGQYFGIHAEVIGGKLIVGNNLIIENETDNGVMQFKVDSSGAWLNNSTFVLQKDNGGQILIDPRYGIVAGTNIFTTSGTTVSPSVLNANGEVDWTNKTNAKFFLDLRTGDAYFRGVLQADSGDIGGWKISSDKLYRGTTTDYVGLGGSTSTYAIWAGKADPASAPFSVTKNGDLYAKNGTFSGTLSAAKVSGTLSANDSNSWLEGCGIRVGANSSATKGYNFYVDTSGNVWMQGSLTLASGAIKWSNLASGVQTEITDAQDAADAAQSAADAAADDAAEAEKIAKQIANGTYTGGTFINRKIVASPTISGGTITGVDIYGAKYHNKEDSYRDTWMELGTSQSLLSECSFKVCSTSWNSKPLFKIYDADIYGVSFSAKGYYFLRVSDYNFETTYPQGTWDFSSATKVKFSASNVEGIDLTAKFG